MTSPYFVRGEMHAPFFNFLRCAGRYADLDLLQRFGLSDYRLTKATPYFLGRYAILADAGEWTLIADDRGYTLWHVRSTRPAMEALGETCDAFACSVGDFDHSYDFVYYRDARLVRRYVAADPHVRGGVVVEDVGEPLPGESSAFNDSDESRIVLGVATSLGIKTDFTERDIRVYAPSKPDRR